MALEFTHTVYRDLNDPEFLHPIRLAVTATVSRLYPGEVNDVSWEPAISLTRDEEDAIWNAAAEELAEARQCARDYAADLRAESAHFDRMGW